MATDTRPLPVGATGRVDKVIELVATSTTSWEHAAQVAVAEAAKSIRHLSQARVVETDLALIDSMPTFRIKLQVSFQLDRNRLDRSGAPIQVRRYLVVANRTLASPGLGQVIEEKLARDPAEFHVIVPEPLSATSFTDPLAGFVGPAGYAAAEDQARKEANKRLESFLTTFNQHAPRLSGEVILTDPLTAIRAVMVRSSFDEIIVSTQPTAISRWLKLDLPHRVERTFGLPVTTLVQADANGDGGKTT